jgi:electron transfer flavoprotein alpha subunit
MVEHKGVMIFCQTTQGKLASSTVELLCGGRKLADDLGEDLSAALVGSDIKNIAWEAIAFGADKVYVVDDILLKDYQTDAYMSTMEEVIKQVVPRILLMGQTSIGQDLAPRLAFRLNSAATLGCLDLAIDPGSKLLLQTKPVYGGNAQAVFVTKSFPQIATVRPKVLATLEPNPSRKGAIIFIDASIDPLGIRIKVLEKVQEKTEGINIEEAKVIVSGGRGIGDAEGFKQLQELAGLLRGAVGASRFPCQKGWIPASAQIGLTGKIVTPELYIAVAISGSSQHMSGCSGSKTIVAINTDPNAHIFKEAHFGVIGDWKKVMPVFIDKLKQLIAE